jgi:hypothetical protein
MVALRYNLDKSVLKEWTETVISNVKDGINNSFDEMYEQLPIYKLEKGTRIVQLTTPSLSPFSVKFVDKLDNTNRGFCGFGSTGK